MKLRITFNILTGTETFDYASVARKEHLKPVEINLRMMEDIVRQIHSEYIYFKDREAAMRYTTGLLINVLHLQKMQIPLIRD